MLVFKSKLTRFVGSLAATRQCELNAALTYAIQFER
jgi:hypothetical protein